ncbi:MAG: hypothetical protein R2712_29755 [Vicinamibacterales bacterium]
MLKETPDGLYCEDGNFFVDPWGVVPRAIVTHAHGDHARPGSAAYLCARPGLDLLRRRVGPEAVLEGVAYGQRITQGRTVVSLHPAGHVLGSAQSASKARAASGWWPATTSARPIQPARRSSRSPATCSSPRARSDCPSIRWTRPARSSASSWTGGRPPASGQAAVVFCYTIGKAQRLLAELAQVTDRTILVHGMLVPPTEIYREAGVSMAPTETLVERARGRSLAGELVLAPPSARGTPWMRRLGDYADALTSGLMRVRGVRRQRAYDRGFVLSDHADWPALLQTVADTGASRVLATHGHAEPLARYLREQGLDAGVIRTAWEGERGMDDAE